jgi:chromosome segregation ATPase
MVCVPCLYETITTLRAKVEELNEQVIALAYGCDEKAEQLQTATNAALSLDEKLAAATQERNRFERHAKVLQVEKANAVVAYERERDKLAAVTQERDDLQDQVNAERDAKYAIQDKLAASQAYSQQFREALKWLESALSSHIKVYGFSQNAHAILDTCKRTLALPSDTTALDRSNKLYAAGVLRELCKFAFTHQCNFDLWLLDKAEQLRKEAE